MVRAPNGRATTCALPSHPDTLIIVLPLDHLENELRQVDRARSLGQSRAHLPGRQT